jgi:HPt (histidine-containing phosphotransfer) domain-containing protein
MTIADQPSPAGATPGLLDDADGIARVLGDRALYARLLRRFHDDYRDGVAPIRSALDSGDIALAHRIAHTVKGAAGMIGARVVHRQAGVLELALRDADAGHDGAIDALGTAISDVLRLIERRLAEEPAQGWPRHPPLTALAMLPAQDLVAQLGELLASGDGAAVDLLEASGASLKAALGEAGLREVTLAMKEFDFEGALEALRRVADAQWQAARSQDGARLSG